MAVKKVISALLLGLCAANADVAFSPIFAPHMVLQHGRAIKVTGTCTESGTVTLTFAGQSVQATPQKGKWSVTLQPLETNATGETMTVTQNGCTATCEDVLVGEVWIASGQSNMLFRMDETGDRNGIAQANNPNLRICRMEPQVHTAPKAYTQADFDTLERGEMFQGTWAVTSPDSVKRMSAVGYYFGDALQRQLGVPVGVINVSLGGSEMLAWVPDKVVKKKFPAFAGDKYLTNPVMKKAWLLSRVNQNLGNSGKSIHPYQPGYLYRTGITPWEEFPIAGVIWYQGESDAEILDDKLNTSILKALVSSWREAFQMPEMPFLMVQLPRINSSEPLRAYWPEFRWIQQEVADSTPGVECVCTIDLGSKDSNVHPPRKLEVGQRLAAVAAKQVYGKDVPCWGPRVSKVTKKGSSLVVEFDNASGLTTTDGQPPVGFEVSADGKTFHPATATIEGETVVLKSDKVKAPKHMRYAWATYLEPNLVNDAKLPAQPHNSALKPSKGKGKKGKGKKGK